MIIKWALTNKCNLNCKHCYNADLRKSNDDITLYDAKKAIDDMKDNNVTNIQFLGGEPLLYSNITDIIKKCTDNGITSWINTNGTLIDNGYAKSLVEAGVRTFIFSIDGPNKSINDEIRGEGSFNKAIKGLEAILRNKKENMLVTINTIVSKKAVLKIDDMIDFISYYNKIDGITISLPDMVGNASNQDKKLWSDYETYYNSLTIFAQKLVKIKSKINVDIGAPPLVKWYFDKKYDTNFFKSTKEYCMGGSSVFFLDADGILYPCNLPSGIKYFRKINTYKELLKNCNIKYKRFQDIFTRNEYLKFFQYVRSRDLTARERFSNFICNECPFAKYNLCGISCPLETKRYPHSALCELLVKNETKKIFKNFDKEYKRINEV
ncbi:Radical SAM superfamily enzyme, MoaA/NifB/PqqE/SkfB family [Caloranaerobacter azorensis DSM 13643]|uniref:Radical SAM superfamily enzyme, MoaA/NifB/PqqE/SkfB family n=1 Tax=Caloranaerobacter azorensis DSM 13643 TaxID=1121264 RepID=A0A1M5RFY0_9FIRM|nr:radical SAM protein [Caloranaerobacter azorensis]SHH25225.1 Radical SAM superfamily enzyme, MoaA/NifB/PqqE/SkfB family [Caloranaerobacter azorensis DSM 13643]